MTLASLLAIVLTKKLGLRSRLTAASETKAEGLGETLHPTEAQLEIIRRLDPHDLRAAQLKGNPPGIRPVA